MNTNDSSFQLINPRELRHGDRALFSSATCKANEIDEETVATFVGWYNIDEGRGRFRTLPAYNANGETIRESRVIEIEIPNGEKVLADVRNG